MSVLSDQLPGSVLKLCFVYRQRIANSARDFMHFNGRANPCPFPGGGECSLLGRSRRPRRMVRGMTGIRKYLKLKIFTITLNGKLGEATAREPSVARNPGRFGAHNQRVSRNAMTLSVA
jgi:hypothetical protein